MTQWTQRKTLEGLLGRSRAGTARLRVRCWESFGRWLTWRREKRWPGSAVDVVDDVAEKMSEAPAASFLRSFGASLVWFEERSGLPENQKLPNDVVKRYLERHG